MTETRRGHSHPQNGPSQAPRILMVTGRADVGGGPEHIRCLLAAGAADYHVAAPRQKPYFGTYQELIGADRVHEIPPRSIAPAAWQAARQAMAAAEPDMVHTHGPAAGALFRPLALAYRTPCVHTYHGVHIDEYSSAARLAYIGVERLLAVVDRAQISVSADELQQLRNIGLGHRAEIIRNGVNVSPPIERGPHAGPIRFVTTARQTHQKDPLGLIAAFAAIDPDVAHLTMFGDGDLSAQVAHAVAEHDHIDFVGHVDSPVLKYPGFDAYLSNSRWEGLPLSVLEAMGSALPAVLSRVPGHIDLANRSGNGVVLFEQSSTADLAAAISTLAKRGVRQAGNEARSAVAADFDAQTMATETAALYTRLVGQR